ncbi:MAG: YqgE/AlgH family protein [Bacteroidetes bacterium]|nr:YqgE/AlgH family protein [Bacteroidota bacterium]
MDFFDYSNKLKPEAGRLLISEPYLSDPNFERTIILLCEHNEEGSVGFVLNKPSLSKLNELINDLSDLENVLCIGGPVQQDTLHFLHQCGDIEGAIEVGDNIYWGGEFEQLIGKIETQQIESSEIKFFVGYSGWSPGQLEEEIKLNSWIVSNLASSELIFETPVEEMWRLTLRKMGGRFSMYSNYPVDPSMN